MAYYGLAFTASCADCDHHIAFDILPTIEFNSMVEEFEKHLFACECCGSTDMRVTSISMVSSDGSRYEMPMAAAHKQFKLTIAPSNQDYFGNDCKTCMYSGQFCIKYDECSSCPLFCNKDGCACCQIANLNHPHCPYYKELVED